MPLPLTYHPDMLRPYCLPLLLGATLFAPLACKDNGSESTTDGEASTTAGATTSATATTPTTTSASTGETPTTTDASSTTAGSTGEATTATSTGGPPPISCPTITDEFECKNTDNCKWGGVVSYAYGNQGCQGNITPFCVDKAPSGGATAWYSGVGNDVQVLEFGYTPELGPEWTQCDCNGPLACLCTSVTEACPERQEDFCGFITTELGCGNVTFMGAKSCNWYLVSPEGAKDDMCAQNPGKYRCMPSSGPFADKCAMDQAPLPPYFGVCNPAAAVDPVYWREANGIVEIVQDCTPPTGFTRCDSVDTVDQPDECGCECV